MNPKKLDKREFFWKNKTFKYEVIKILHTIQNFGQATTFRISNAEKAKALPKLVDFLSIAYNQSKWKSECTYQ